MFQPGFMVKENTRLHGFRICKYVNSNSHFSDFSVLLSTPVAFSSSPQQAAGLKTALNRTAFFFLFLEGGGRVSDDAIKFQVKCADAFCRMRQRGGVSL